MAVSEDDALKKFGYKKRTKQEIDFILSRGRRRVITDKVQTYSYKERIEIFFESRQNYFQTLRNIAKSIIYQAETNGKECHFDFYVDVHDPYNVDTYAWTEYFKIYGTKPGSFFKNLNDVNKTKLDINHGTIIFLLRSRLSNAIVGYQFCFVIEPTGLPELLADTSNNVTDEIKNSITRDFGNIVHINTVFSNSSWNDDTFLNGELRNYMSYISQLILNTVAEEVNILGYFIMSDKMRKFTHQESFKPSTLSSEPNAEKIEPTAAQFNLLKQYYVNNENTTVFSLFTKRIYLYLKGHIIIKKSGIIYLWTRDTPNYIEFMSNVRTQYAGCTNVLSPSGFKSLNIIDHTEPNMGIKLFKLCIQFAPEIARFLTPSKKGCSSKLSIDLFKNDMNTIPTQLQGLSYLVAKEEPNYIPKDYSRIVEILYDELEDQQIPVSERKRFLSNGVSSFYNERPMEFYKKLRFDTNNLHLDGINDINSVVFKLMISDIPIFIVGKLHYPRNGDWCVFEMLHPYVVERVNSEDLQMILRFFLIKFAVLFSKQLKIEWIVEVNPNKNITDMFVKKFGFMIDNGPNEEDQMDVDTEGDLMDENLKYTKPYFYLTRRLEFNLQNKYGSLCYIKQEDYQERYLNSIEYSLNECTLDIYIKPAIQSKIRIAQRDHTCAECGDTIKKDNEYTKKKVGDGLYLRHCNKH
jgi:hypothetical protein